MDHLGWIVVGIRLHNADDNTVRCDVGINRSKQTTPVDKNDDPNPLKESSGPIKYVWVGDLAGLNHRLISSTASPDWEAVNIIEHSKQQPDNTRENRTGCMWTGWTQDDLVLDSWRLMFIIVASSSVSRSHDPSSNFGLASWVSPSDVLPPGCYWRRDELTGRSQ